MGLFYRCDKRVFEGGQTITTAGQFMELHPENGKRTEVLLAEAMPAGKPDRAGCLMLFENLACAREHCSKMPRGHLYSVEVDESDILHRGDMHLVDEIDRRIATHDDVGRLPMDYWEGVLTDAPCIEVLVATGVVVADLLYTQAERDIRTKERHNATFGTFPPTESEEDWPPFVERPS